MISKFIQLINNINPQIQEPEWTSSKICTQKNCSYTHRSKTAKKQRQRAYLKIGRNPRNRSGPPADTGQLHYLILTLGTWIWTVCFPQHMDNQSSHHKTWLYHLTLTLSVHSVFGWHRIGPSANTGWVAVQPGPPSILETLILCSRDSTEHH